MNRHERRLLRWPEVYARVPYSRQHIDRLEKAGLFPRRVKLNPNGGRNGAVGWYDNEIDAYQDARAASRDTA